MATKVREQADREDRILFEIVVDAYDETERAMGWYCYLQDNLQMPFNAKCASLRRISPLVAGAEVRVIEMAPEEDCMSEVFVVIEHNDEQFAVPLSQIECLADDAETCQAVADWHYWVARGYRY